MSNRNAPCTNDRGSGSDRQIETGCRGGCGDNGGHLLGPVVAAAHGVVEVAVVEAEADVLLVRVAAGHPAQPVGGRRGDRRLGFAHPGIVQPPARVCNNRRDELASVRGLEPG